MFSTLVAAQTAAMRPGVISGPYPERSREEAGGLDRALDRLAGTLDRFAGNRKPGLNRVVSAIGRLEDEFSGLDGANLSRRVTRLRHDLRSQGLCTRHCVRAFALVREMSRRTLGLRHYDAQLMAGWVMLHGKLAEMETGEGKTLAATLAAATAALAGVPVHVITVNEYLVSRDARAMAPLYEALGLTVGHVTQDMTLEVRKTAYACDITYCTNKQIAFDYLRDRLLIGRRDSFMGLRFEELYADESRLGRLLLRGLCFAIIDEADSVLIDEARTPLILTREIKGAETQSLYPRVLKLAKELKEGADYLIDKARQDIQLTLAAQRKLKVSEIDLGGLWRHVRQREVLVQQALQALHLFIKDRDYLVQDGQVVIIDANTGRTMPDRSWERGLHQMVEAKEGCPISVPREQLGRITYQRFFRRYLRVGGMTGTAREVAPELRSVYGLRVRRIPLHRPSRRQQLPARVCASCEEKWRAVAHLALQHRAKGRPVLIGTGSVADSEIMSRMLAEAGIGHRVLNARQDRDEADIVAEAGRKGQVTVATNMAGRGTDIPLGSGVAELGGLLVIATCRNEAARIDRQLYGRCARKGDPGSHQSILSMEDELLRRNCSPGLLRFLRRRGAGGGPIRRRMSLLVMRWVQRRIEGRHREARCALMKSEGQTGRLLAFSGNME